MTEPLETPPENRPPAHGWNESAFINRTFALFGALTIFALLFNKYVPGMDLPQHANLFQLWANYGSPAHDYGHFHSINLLTPYLIPYALGTALTKIVGALPAVKILILVAAIATPWTMIRWLRAIGADPLFGLFGFVLAFGFAFLWGFLSNTIALPFMFAHLESFERQSRRFSWRGAFGSAVLALLLFFSHGITFGIAVLSTGIRACLTRRVRTAFGRLAHLLPAFAVVLTWVSTQSKTTGLSLSAWPVFRDRALHLFGGAFSPSPAFESALLGLCIVAVVATFARPRPARTIGPWIPMAVALAAYSTVPEWVSGTYLVGTRLCIYLQAFAPAIWTTRTDGPGRRRLGWCVAIIVTACLVGLNVRMLWFNREARGFDVIATAIEPGQDVRTLMPDTNSHSAAFGDFQFAQMPAWITAHQGGLMENDYANYLQIPVQRRRERPFPNRFRYLVARGEEKAVRRTVQRLVGPARLVRQADSWFVFEKEPLVLNGLTVLRSAQGWGDLQLNKTVQEKKLVIAGKPFSSGFGTHADSFIRLRVDRKGGQLTGSCGIDDEVKARSSFRFLVSDVRGPVLFDSGLLRGGAAARNFAIPVRQGQQLHLQVLAKDGDLWGAHADWAGLQVTGD